MMKKAAFVTMCVAAALAISPAFSDDVPMGESELIVLCFHDVPKAVLGDKFGVDQVSFVNMIEYFRAYGFVFVSLQDVLDAKDGKKPLPARAVMLTFDDGYQSFYDFVFPVLKEYGIPAMLSIVTRWAESGLTEYPTLKFMNWQQIAEVAQHPLVEVASHSHDLHHAVVYNPQGNKAAAVNRLYDAGREAPYENDDDYRRRIFDDLKTSKRLLEEKTGQSVRAIVWPYGAVTAIAREESRKAGFVIDFGLEDTKADSDFESIERFLIYKNPTTNYLLNFLGIGEPVLNSQRIVQIDMDWIYDEDEGQREKNLSALLERIKALKPTTVYLQAFSDLEANGDIKAVYFPNSVLPMRGDYFNRVVHQLRTRTGVYVYAWMPMLSIHLPDEALNDELRVMEFKDGAIVPSSSWYSRLSPFNPKARSLLVRLYDEMARNAQISGVVFQDDGYLNDFEDFNGAALESYKKITGGEVKDPRELSDEQRRAWTQERINAINSLSQMMMEAVTSYRPEAKFARTIYAPVVTENYGREWFSQDYAASLALYDHVVVMAYPAMERKFFSDRWLTSLVKEAKRHPSGLKKTVFKLQAYDWRKSRWIDEEKLQRWFETLVSSGARHVAYYPDNYLLDRPQLQKIKTSISYEDFPFKRDWE
jgi:biofilm PGA synthesis lipoprotein PgaB